MGETKANAPGGPSSFVVLCVYVAAYVFLDRISLLQALPNIGFTLWNPPPASSLALLLIKGPRFAPALFLAAVLGDILNGAVSIWVFPALILDGIIAAGYTVVALVLRAFGPPWSGIAKRTRRNLLPRRHFARSSCDRLYGRRRAGADGCVPVNQFAETVR